MRKGELHGRVNGLAALDPERQIAAGHDKQLPEWHGNTIPVAVRCCQPATPRERSSQKFERYWSWMALDVILIRASSFSRKAE
jgi:hypothetical protein